MIALKVVSDNPACCRAIGKNSLSGGFGIDGDQEFVTERVGGSNLGSTGHWRQMALCFQAARNEAVRHSKTAS